MRANTPLLTDSSRLASEQNVDNYSVGVATHINGDWLQHVQISIINKNWIDSAGNIIPNSKRLRFLATVDGQDVALVVPIVPFKAGTTGNGPQITQQPTNQTVKVGGSVIFTVQATGDPALTYQWRYAEAAIAGAVSPQLALTNVQLSNAGQYDCVIGNPFGVVISNSVTLTVTT
jgi:hypothetical protein